LLFGVSEKQLSWALKPFQATPFVKDKFIQLVASLTTSPNHTATDTWSSFQRKVNKVLNGHINVAEALWRDFMEDKIEIVCSMDMGKEPIINNLTYEQELLATGDVFRFFRAQNRSPHVAIRVHTSSSKMDGRKNRLLLGGPQRNEVSKEFLNDYTDPLPFGFLSQGDGAGKHPQSQMTFDAKTYSVKYGDPIKVKRRLIGRHVKWDYAIALRLKKEHSSTLLLAGCHAYGTRAAAMCITDEKLLSVMKRLLPQHTWVNDRSFVALCKVRVRNGSIDSVDDVEVRGAIPIRTP